MTRRIVVTGVGAISPCGANAESTWDAMVEGRSGIGPITRFDPKDWPVQIAGEVKGFDSVALLGRRDARRMDRFTQFALRLVAFIIAQDPERGIGKPDRPVGFHDNIVR